MPTAPGDQVVVLQQGRTTMGSLIRCLTAHKKDRLLAGQGRDIRIADKARLEKVARN